MIMAIGRKFLKVMRTLQQRSVRLGAPRRAGRPRLALWVAAVLAWAALPAGAQIVPLGPSNDYFTNAWQLIGDSGTTNGSSYSATYEAGEPTHWLYNGFNSVWFRWSPSAASSYYTNNGFIYLNPAYATFDTRGTFFDSVLAVYEYYDPAGLTNPVTRLNPLYLYRVANNDDFNAAGTPVGKATNLYSQVTFLAYPGTTYYVAVAGYTDLEEGSYVLNWNLSGNFTNAAPTTNEFNFTQAEYSVAENTPGYATIGVSYNNSNSTAPAFVDYATSAGPTNAARQGTDYLYTYGTLVFQPGETLKTFTVPIIDNALPNVDKTILLSLSRAGGGGAVLGAQRFARLTIVDDETVPPPDLAGTFQFSSISYRVTDMEAWNYTTYGGTLASDNTRCIQGALITVTRSAPAVGRVLVDFATTNKFNLTNLLGAYYSDYVYLGLASSYYYGGALYDLIYGTYYYSYSTLYYPPIVIAEPGYEYMPTNGTLVFDDYQMSASFVVPIYSYSSTTLDRAGLTNALRIFNVVLSNPRAAPEEDPNLIAPKIGSTNEAVVGIVDVSGGSAGGLYGTNLVNGFSIVSAHYRANEFGRREFLQSSTNVSRLAVDVILPGGAGGSVNVIVARSFTGGGWYGSSPYGQELMAGSDYADADDNILYSRFFNRAYPNTIATDGSDPMVNPNDFIYTNFTLTIPRNFTETSFIVNITNDTQVEFNEDFMIYLRPINNQPVLGPNPYSSVTILYDDQPAGAVDREWNPENVSYSTPPYNPMPGANNVVYAAAVQADQRTVLGGDFTGFNGTPVNRVVRLLQNGFFDTSFRSGVGADNAVYSLVIYPTGSLYSNDNKIVLGGAFSSYNGLQRNGVARLNPDGSLDDTFRPGFGANGPVYSVALQSDGKVLVGGEFTQFNGENLNRLARLNNDGTIDRSFNPGYGADGPIHAVAVRDLSTNIFFARAAYSNHLEDVYVVETGANGGQLALNYDFPITNNLRIYYGPGQPLLDLTVGGQGAASLNFGPGVSTQVRIVMNEGLSGLDARWRYSGTILPNVTNRTLFVAGSFVAFDGVYCGGAARLLTNGALDLSFSAGAGANGTVWSAAVQPDGKLLLGGDFSDFDFHARNGLTRLNLDGSVDESFNPGSGLDGPVYAIALQPDMKPVIGGKFTRYNTTRRMGVARLFTTGALDTGFLDTGFNQFAGLCRTFSFDSPGFVSAVALESDGDVIIGGYFTNKLGGNTAYEVNNAWTPFPCWTRADKTGRQNVTRLIGTWGLTPTEVPVGTNTAIVLLPNSPQGPGNLNFLQSTYSVDEISPTLAVTLRRVDGRMGTVDAIIASSNSTAVAGRHFLSVNTNVTWPEDFYTTNWIYRNVGGPAPRQVGYVGYSYLWVPILDEAFIEGDHTFDLGMFQAQGSLLLGGETIPLGAALGDTSARVTIVDNDVARGTFVFASPTYTFNKGDGFAHLTVLRTNGTAGTVTVDYYTADNSPLTTAVSDQSGGTPDYSSKRGTLTLSADVASGTIDIPIWNNTQVAFDKTVLVVLTNAGGGANLPGGMSTSSASTLFTIVDDNYQPGRVNFSVTNFMTNENAGVAVATVSRSGGSLGELRVTASTAPGTAVPGVNYSDVSQVLFWPSGDSAGRTLLIPLTNDAKVAGPLTIRLSLSNPLVSGSPAPQALGSRANALLTVTDDDSYGTFNFSLPRYFVDENGGAASFTVLRQSNTVGTVTVDFATEDQNDLDGYAFVGKAGTLVFGPKDTSKSFSVTILDNTDMTGDEDFYLRLSSPWVVVDTNFVATNSSATLLLNKSYGVPFPAGVSGLGQPNPATVTVVDDESASFAAGSLDVNFNENSAVGADAPVYALAYQTNDNRILMAGDFRRVNSVRRNSIARLNPDASLDGQFNVGTGPNGAIRALAVEASSRILIGGMFTSVNGTNRNHIARLNPDGSLDGSFNPGSGTDSSVSALALQSDGRILVAGSFTFFNGQPQPYIVRLNTNGTVHGAFHVGVGPDRPVQALAIQPDGKILIGGDFTSVNNDPSYPRVARLNPDGSLDTTFRPGAGADSTVRALVVQADGRILVGGSFTNFNNRTVNYLARLLPTGALDTNYAAAVLTNRGANDVVYTLALQADGKLLVGGGFTRFHGVSRNGLTRLNEDGTTDPSINFGAGANGFIAALALQADRKIIVGGGFTEVQGRTRLYVARLHGGALSGSGRFQFSASEYNVVAANGFGVVTVQRQGGTFGSSSVKAQTSDGTAQAGRDYLTVSTNLVFPEGEVLKSFVVPLTNGHFYNNPRWLDLQLSAAPLGDQPNSRLNIYSEDCRVGFEAFSFSIARNVQSGLAPITIIRSDSSNSTVRVNFAISPGTNNPALPGVDYLDVTNYNIIATVTTNSTNLSLMVTNYSTNFLEFRPGEMSKVVLVPIIATNGGAGNKTAFLTLSNVWPPDVASLLISNATLTIVDDQQAAGILAFSTTNYYIPENGSTAVIKVIRRGGSGGAVSVSYRTQDGTARAGRDYVSASGNLGFNEGETEKFIYVSILDNGVPNPDRTVLLSLFRPTGGAGLDLSNAVLNVQEYLVDTNYFTFASTNFFAVETDPFALITVLRTNNTRGVAFVDFDVRPGTAQPGYNYVATNGTLVFLEGDNLRRFTVPLLHDRLGTADLTNTLRLLSATNPLAGPKQPVITLAEATLFLTNVDTSLRFSSSAYATREDSTNLTLTVFRDGVSNLAVTVGFATVAGGTAVAGLHYLPTNGTLSWPSNDMTPKTFQLRVIDDNEINADRTIFLALSNATGLYAYAGVPSNTVVTVLNNDTNVPLSGDLDGSFNSRFGANDTVYTAGFALGDDHMYVGGAFTYVHGVQVGHFARLATNGAVDLTFAAGGGFDQPVHAYAVAEAGAVAVGGEFTNYNGQPFGRVALLETNGLPVPRFHFTNGADATVRAVAFANLPTLEYQTNSPVSTNGQTTLWTTNYTGATEGTAILNWTFQGLGLGGGGGPITNTNTVVVVVTNDLRLYYDAFLIFQTNVIVDSPNAVSGSTTVHFGPGQDTNLVVGVNVGFPTGRPWQYDLTIMVGSPFDRKVLIGGDFKMVNGLPMAHLALLNPDGSLDAEFTRNLSSSGVNNSVYALAAWNAGNSNFFYAAGEFATAGPLNIQATRVARFFANGQLDPSFLVGLGPDGTVRSLALQPDGRLLLAGDFGTVNGVPRNHVARLNLDGSVDLSFDPGSGANGTLHSVAALDDGMILVGGAFTAFDGDAYAGYARLYPDGSLDTALDVRMGATNPPVVRAIAGRPGLPSAQWVFGSMDSLLFTSSTGVSNLLSATNALGLANGSGQTNLVLGFTRGVIHLLATNYSTTNAFDPNYQVPSPVQVYYGGALLLQTNLVGGALFDLPFAGIASNLTFAVNLGLTNGPAWSLDWMIEPTMNLVSVPAKTLIGGEFTKVGSQDRQRLALLSGDGALDGSFYPFGNFHTVVSALGLYTNLAQPALVGRVMVGGDFNVLVGGTPLSNYARLNLDGTLDETFHTGTGADRAVRAVAVQPDGQAIIAGAFTNVDQVRRAYVARLGPDGLLDPLYNSGVGPNGAINAVALQPDGNLVIGGEFTAVYGTGRNRIARLNAFSGTVDTNFYTGVGANGVIRAVALQANGQVLVGGDFTTMNNLAFRSLARLTSLGAVDTAFAANGLFNGPVTALALQSDGRILVGGSFTIAAAGHSYVNLARLNSSGTLDTTFADTLASGLVTALAVQSDDRVLVGGAFTLFDGQVRNRMARLNANGSLDVTINLGVGANNTVNALVAQTYDGNILVGGAFTEFAGQVRVGVARVFDGVNAGNGQFRFSLAQYSYGENATNAFVTVLRSGGASNAVSVQYATVPGSARPGVDYVTTSGVTNFAAGETFKIIQIPLLDNSVLNPDRSFSVRLSNPSGAGLGTPATAGVTLADNECVVGFHSDFFTAVEGSNSVVRITVERQGGLSDAFSVDYATTTNGTALPGVDYVPVAGTLLFRPGINVVSFDVPIVDNQIIAYNPTVGLVLSNATAPALLGRSTAVLSIVNDDLAPGVLTFSTNNFFCDEAIGAFATITVVRTNGYSGAVSVNYTTANGSAVAGVNYLGASGLLNFADGETSQTFTVSILDDTQLTGDKTVLLRLFNPGGGATLGVPTSTLTIREGDSAGRFEFADPVFTASEDAGSALISVRRLGATLAGLSNSVTVVTLGGTGVAGRDYVAVSNVVIFTSNQTVKTVSVPLLNNTTVDGTRSVGLALLRPTGGATLGQLSAATLLILDRQTGFTFAQTNYVVSETGQVASITVLRLGNTNEVQSVSFATSVGAEAPPFMTSKFVPTNGVLTFAKGETNKAFQVRVLNESLTEGNVAVNLTLSTTSGALLGPIVTATLTILDDDSAFVFSSPNYSVYKSGTNVLITVLRQGNTSAAASVNFLTTDETAVSFTNYIPTNGLLLFAPGQLTNSFQVAVLNTNRAIGDRTVRLTLFNATNATPGEAYARLFILDDTKLITFSTNYYWASSKATNALITLRRQGPSDGELAATVMSSNGTAVVGQDYLAVSNVVRWTAGDVAPKVVQVRVLDDGTNTGSKTVNLYLTNAPGLTNAFNGGTLDPSNNTATLAIVDNAGSISLSLTNLQVIEGQTNQLIFVRTGGTNGIVSVDYRISGGTVGLDYTSDLITVSFGHGVTVQTNYLPFLHNTNKTGMRLFSISLTNAQGGAMIGSPAMAWLTVLDADVGLIVPVGVSLLSENKITNGVIDPGEKVTIAFGLRNLGIADAVNVSGLLLATNNLTLTNAPAAFQSNFFGTLGGNGGVVSRAYSFTAGTGAQLVVPLVITEPGPNGGLLTNLIYNFSFLLGTNTISFANRNPITLNDNSPATPFPSVIRVDGTRGPITNVTVTLYGLTHGYPADLDILLESPYGDFGLRTTNSMIMSDVGGGNQVSNLTITLSDAALSFLPVNGQLTNGSYRPFNNIFSDNNTPLAPPNPHGTNLAVFNGLSGTDVNGDWKLFIWDDSDMEAGVLSSGWSLSLQSVDMVSQVADLAVTIVNPAPTVVAGTVLTNRIWVVNNGPANVSRVFLTNVIPSEFTPSRTNGVAVPASTNRLFVFDLGAMDLGKSNLVTVEILAPTPASANLSVRVASPNVVEIFTNNNVGTLKLTALPADQVADLGVSFVGLPTCLTEGMPFTFGLLLTNHSGSTASVVGLTNPWPDGLTLLSTTLSLLNETNKDRAAVQDGELRLLITNLPAHAAALLTVQASVSALPPTLVLNATVAAETRDLNDLNNAAAVSLTLARCALPASPRFSAPKTVGGHLMLDWSATPAFRLEETPTLSPPAWTAVPLTNGQVTFEIIPGSSSTKFYRLRYN